MVDKKRHIAKAVSWRIVGTLDTVLVGWYVTGDPLIGASIGAIEIFTKVFLYYGHERIWYNFSSFGVGKKNGR
jgi:uncharacterized membrane protein